VDTGILKTERMYIEWRTVLVYIRYTAWKL